MTPEIASRWSEIKEQYGARSIWRVEAMLLPDRQNRHFLQRDAKWVMPGLQSRPWRDPYENSMIRPIVSGFEELHPIMKKEIHNVIDNVGRPVERYSHYKGMQDDWKALYLFRDGRVVAENQELVPETFKFMKDVIGDWLCPLLEMHFSILEPHSRILPHCDLWNFTINLHLAIDIPEGCGIRVAGVDRQWVEGKCILFDYSFLHEAWNDSERKRICLLVDIWNPEVTEAERKALTVLISEIRKMMDD